MKMIGQTKLVLQVFQQVDHLGLDGYIQGGDRLVGDDNFGLQSQGTGNAKALALPTAEGVWDSGSCAGP